MNRETNILNRLENELSLKQLQITSLLNITQAINENLPQEDLFRMYKDFLTWELSIEKLHCLLKTTNLGNYQFAVIWKMSNFCKNYRKFLYTLLGYTR